jgi:hypothetical protein
MSAPRAPSSSALDAAALQQHRAASLGLPGASRRRVAVAVAAGAGAGAGSAARAAGGAPAPPPPPLLLRPPSSEAERTEGRLAARWACEACRAVHGERNQARCEACGAARAGGGGGGGGGGGVGGGGRSRGGAGGSGAGAAAAALPPPQRQSMSLAQARGLVAPPRALLGEAEWLGVEARFGARREARCAVCLDRFALREVVVTSCSHGFHAACLASLARFADARSDGGGDGSRPCVSCPVCRRAPLETRRTRVAAAQHVSRCVARLQAVHRGRLQRRRFFAQRRALYLGRPAGGRRGALAFAAEALGDLTKELGRALAAGAAGVDALLGDVDASVAASRLVMQRVDARRAASGAASAHAFAAPGGAAATAAAVGGAALAAPSSAASTSSVAAGALHAAAPVQAPAPARRSGAARPASVSAGGARAGAGAGAGAGADAREDEDAGAALRLLEILSERLALVESRQRRLAGTRAHLAREHALQAAAAARRAQEELAAARGARDEAAPPPRLSAADWAGVRAAAERHGHEDCAICLAPLAPAAGHGHAGDRGAALLSCAHSFHVHCLDSFEAFARGKAIGGGGSGGGGGTGGGAGGAAGEAAPWPRCAMCRQRYWRERE